MTENQKLREALLSDMDIAVLRMPVRRAFAGDMAQFQYHNRVQALLNRIDALALPTADHLPDAGEMVVDHFPDATKMIETAAPVGERGAFEREMSKPPFEFCMDRWPDDGAYAWPGNYAAYHTQCAWDAWQARAALSAGDALDAARYRWLADCNNYEAGLALIIDPKLTEQALGAAIDAAILARGEADPLTRYRVWPDGTVQEGSESPYAWMSDDFTYVNAVNEEQAHKLANEGLRATQHALGGEAEA